MMVVPAAPLPLFIWPEQAQIAALSEQRADLVRRIAMVPRFSHRRVELETRMRAITEQQLRLERSLATKGEGR